MGRLRPVSLRGELPEPEVPGRYKLGSHEFRFSPRRLAATDDNDERKHPAHGDDADSEDDECPICMERPIQAVLTCGHAFCNTCIQVRERVHVPPCIALTYRRCASAGLVRMHACRPPAAIARRSSLLVAMMS